MRREIFVIVDNVRSLENVGSVFRCADALGVVKVYLCGISGTPNNPKLAKTALGAEQTVSWEYHAQTWRLIQKLQAQGVCVVALEQSPKSIPLQKFTPRFPLALVIGHEVKGVSRFVLQHANAIVEIPMAGQKESLNVAVAFGIAAYTIRNRAPRATLP